MYFSHTAQEAHNKTLARQARKTILVTVGVPCNPTIAVEHSSTTPPLSGSLAAQLSNAPTPVNAGPSVHDPTMDTKSMVAPPVPPASMVAPPVPPASTSMPMDVDEASATPSGQDIGTDMSVIYINKTP